MQDAGGLVSVSADYIDTLKSRYSWLKDAPAAVLPFGAAAFDFDVIRNSPQPNRFFQRDSGKIHGVYVGRAGTDMAPALRIIFGALRTGLRERPELFSKVRLHFIGTDYAPAHLARKTVEPVAEELGVLAYVEEHPARIPYFEGLQLLMDADFLIVPGSDDPQYTASKIFPYILARKPILALFNERSSVCQIVRRTAAGKVLGFQPELSPESYTSEFYRMMIETLSHLPFEPETDWAAFEPYTACETARKQCELFDQVRH